MSEGKEEPVELSEEVVLLQQNGDLVQCVSRLRLLQRRLTEVDRCGGASFCYFALYLLDNLALSADMEKPCFLLFHN